MPECPRPTDWLSGYQYLCDAITAIEDLFVATYAPYKGSIYVSEASGSQSISGTYVLINQFTANGISSGVTPDYTTGTITLPTAGEYHVMANPSFSGGLNTTFTMTVHVDGAPQPQAQLIRKLGTGGDVGSASLQGDISVNANAVVDLRIKCDGVSQAFSLEACNFRVQSAKHYFEVA